MSGRSLVAIYRNPSYSPRQHRTNDTAILDATVDRFTRDGWEATRISEADVEHGRLPAATLYLNMCQGPLASQQLLPLEDDGAMVVNRPSSVLSCHRHRLVRALAGHPAPFPRTLILPTAAHPTMDAVRALCDGHPQLWVKRGDVHAERPEDVVSARPADVPMVLQQFARRGIPWAALQEHVPGPIIKFYGIADRRFFRWYGADAGAAGPRPRVDETALQQIAFAAAEALSLDIFGGDVAVPDPQHPVLIDINDWPSFAPFRAEAAEAIGDYVAERVATKQRI
jgi:hypothetical protein